MNVMTKLCLLAMFILSLAVAAQAAEDTVAPGTKITMQNWQRYRQFMPDGMAALFEGRDFWKMPQDVEMEVAPTIIHPLPKGYDEATERFSQQVKIIHKPDGKIMITGYQGGQPFPHPSGPDKGWEVLANLWFRYVPHLVVITGGAICLQDDYRNVNCNTAKLVYRQLNYNTDPDIPVVTPGASTEHITLWIMTLTPENEKYRTTLAISYNDITKPQGVYVFIPALRRYQPVAAGARCSPWSGTDATPDDLRFGFNGLIGEFRASFLGERKILALTDYDLPKTSFPDGFDMPLGWPKPSWGNWQLRDVNVIDVRKIPSAATGYCYGKRIMYVDRQFNAPIWEELYDTEMHLWKIMAVFTHTLDVPQIGPVNSNYSQVEEIWNLKNDHATYFIVPAKGQPLYLNQEAPKEYNDVDKYSTPGGLNEIMR